MKVKEFKTVAHTLGIDVEFASRSHLLKDSTLPQEFYRNYFLAGTDKHHSFNELKGLEDKEFMERQDHRNGLYFFVTEKGITRFREMFFEDVTSKFKPLTKNKAVYQDYLHSDCADSFTDHLGIVLPKVKYGKEGVRIESQKYYGLRGDWKLTIKEAKVSYKEKLKVRLKENKCLS